MNEGKCHSMGDLWSQSLCRDIVMSNQSIRTIVISAADEYTPALFSQKKSVPNH